jgi:hypothetical protein
MLSVAFFIVMQCVILLNAVILIVVILSFITLSVAALFEKACRGQTL